MTRTVLVLGSPGQVGRAVLREAYTVAPAIQVVAASRQTAGRSFLLEAPETIADLVKSVHPDFALMLAAATNVAWCQQGPSLSSVMNGDAVRASALAAASVGASLAFGLDRLRV